VSQNVNSNRKAFFDKFQGEMYNIHMNMRELKESTNEKHNKLKLDKDILDRKAERDWFKNECNKLDAKCHDRQEALNKMKGKHQEYN
jgi:hypothetical protein